MKRKLVQAGGSLAVTLPAEVVQEFELKKGMTVEVSVHPQTGAVTIRPGVRVFEGGKATAVEDFATGFLSAGTVSARPVDVVVGRDGALYLSSDQFARDIFRITYRPH